MADTFETDLDKVYDLLQLSKADFLASYSYLSEEEYDDTVDLLFVNQEGDDLGEENEEVVGNLADLFRSAENLHIKNMNGENEGWNVTGEQLKEAIYGHVTATLSQEQINSFEEIIRSMGV